MKRWSKRKQNFSEYAVYVATTKVVWLWQRATLSCNKFFNRIRHLGTTYVQLKATDVLECKTSDILIILGSGSSINDLTSKQWEYISRNDSLGFNFWWAHPFIPTFYHIEACVDVLQCSDIQYHYISLIKNLNDSYKRVPFLISQTTVNQGWHPKYHPQFFPPEVKIFVYGKIISKNIPLEREIKESDFYDVTFKFGDSPIQSCSSLTTIIHLGLQLGYKKIILAGVDLYDNQYFHDGMSIMKWYRESKAREYQGQAETHSTTFNYDWHAVDSFIPAFNEFVLKPKGVELYVANPKSLLYPYLPYHSLEG